MGDPASTQAETRVNAEQASKDRDAGADLSVFQGRPPSSGEEATRAPIRSRRGSGVGMHVRGKSTATREAPSVSVRDAQPDSREGQAGPTGVAERPVVVVKPGNAGGAKGPWVKVNVGSGENQESGVSLIPPRTVEKLQATLHAKAKGSPDSRFHAGRWLDELTEPGNGSVSGCVESTKCRVGVTHASRRVSARGTGPGPAPLV